MSERLCVTCREKITDGWHECNSITLDIEIYNRLIEEGTALRKSNAELQTENKILRTHLEKRATGTDPLATALREDRDKLEKSNAELAASGARMRVALKRVLINVSADIYRVSASAHGRAQAAEDALFDAREAISAPPSEGVRVIRWLQRRIKNHNHLSPHDETPEKCEDCRLSQHAEKLFGRDE